jgi:hypothetical protein
MTTTAIIADDTFRRVSVKRIAPLRRRETHKPDAAGA